MKKILFIGGHHTPAVSVIQEIRKENLPVNIVWVGHKFTMVNDTSVSAEYKEIIDLNIPFIELKAAKMFKNVNLFTFIKFIKSLYFSFKIIKKEKPDLVASFGGYLAVPIVIIAKVFGIKIITHEQTRSAGFANRVIAYFADEILLTWPSSARFYKKFYNKTSITGLPIRQDIYKGKRLDTLNTNLLTIYITGGKQGSHIINLVIEESLNKLLQNFNVIHQVGSNSYYKDYDRMNNLGKNGKGKYIIKKFVSQHEIGDVFKSADIVITRGGANTIYELGLLGKPAIIIPISKSSHNEQFENARFLQGNGLASIITEEKLTSKTLILSLNSIKNQLKVYKKNAKKINAKLIKNADVEITEKIRYWLSK